MMILCFIAVFLILHLHAAAWAASQTAHSIPPIIADADIFQPEQAMATMYLDDDLSQDGILDRQV